MLYLGQGFPVCRQARATTPEQGAEEGQWLHIREGTYLLLHLPAGAF